MVVEKWSVGWQNLELSLELVQNSFNALDPPCRPAYTARAFRQIGKPDTMTRFMHKYMDEVMLLSTRQPKVHRIFFEVIHMIKPPAALFAPGIILGVLGQVIRTKINGNSPEIFTYFYRSCFLMNLEGNSKWGDLDIFSYFLSESLYFL